MRRPALPSSKGRIAWSSPFISLINRAPSSSAASRDIYTCQLSLASRSEQMSDAVNRYVVLHRKMRARLSCFARVELEAPEGQLQREAGAERHHHAPLARMGRAGLQQVVQNQQHRGRRAVAAL